MNNDSIPQKTKHQQLEINLLSWIESFLIDRKAAGLTPGSVRFYRQKLKIFTDYCETQDVSMIEEITPVFIREFLLDMGDKGHTPGGTHGVFRSLKAFLLWYEDEAEPERWKNPIRKVKAPKVPEEPIDPVELADVDKMIAVCDRGSFTGDRDRALMLFLLETGMRAEECLDLNLSDLDLPTGEGLIRQGKGRKPRPFFFQQKARRALRSYLKHRSDKNPALWVTDEMTRLQYGGLRDILVRRAKKAGVEPIPTAHDFRRAFTITMLRNGVDVLTISRLLGHTSLAMLKRYAKQVAADLKDAHQRGSPVDNAKMRG